MSKTKSATQQPTTLTAQSISDEVLLEKYAKDGEKSIPDVNQRVARALAQAEEPAQRAHWEARFLQALQERLSAGGRIQSAAGTDLSATLINCFVQPVGDSIAHDDDGYPGIYIALDPGGRDHAQGRRRRLRLLAHPPARRLGRQHAQQRLGPGELHARVRPLLRDRRVGRRAARRADGRVALRPSGHRGVHPRQGHRAA